MKRYIVLYIELKWHSLNVDDHSDYFSDLIYDKESTLMTFQISDLIREFKSRKLFIIPELVDLESFDKQMSQEGKEFREVKCWKALSFLKYHQGIDSDFVLTCNTVKTLLEGLATIYLSLLNKDQEEKRRFEEVEIKVNQLIYRRQFKGIRIDREMAKRKCQELEYEIYRLKNILQLDYNIFAPDNQECQVEYLNKKKYNIIESPLYTFKVRRKEDKVCDIFYELLRSQQDLESFLYILAHWGGQQRTYPTYVGFGTITSRIILRQPCLQNLRKINRSIIVPDQRMKLLYIDYCQFEAGILASLSGDDLLIDLYNTDIYNNLAEEVLGDKEKRSEAKIIFYRYMYGDTTLNNKAVTYFKKFDKLSKFRETINNEILTKEKVGTSCGNYRRSKMGEHPWSLSHVIQATASLIYKNALLRVWQEVPYVQFLIPMHDATLYQIRDIQYDVAKFKIELIYIEEYKKICKQINPRVTCSETF